MCLDRKQKTPKRGCLIKVKGIVGKGMVRITWPNIINKKKEKKKRKLEIGRWRGMG